MEDIVDIIRKDGRFGVVEGAEAVRNKIIEIYGYGVCDAFGSEHCVGKCQDTRDCGAKPIKRNS